MSSFPKLCKSICRGWGGARAPIGIQLRCSLAGFIYAGASDDVVDVTVTATLAAGAPVVPVWIETIWHTPPVHVFGFVKVAVAPLTSA